MKLRIVHHGLCETLPWSTRENHSGSGTFEGLLHLGGKDYEGSFDFISRGHIDPSATPPFRARVVILRGYGGMAGLHGVLDLYSPGLDLPFEYEGQIHIDPQ